jgi:hypothetical protein
MLDRGPEDFHARLPKHARAIASPRRTGPIMHKVVFGSGVTVAGDAAAAEKTQR